MSEKIIIDYDAVYTKTAELRRHLEAELREMNNVYRHAHNALRHMSGKTHEHFVEAMTQNQNKAQVTAETLRKLITFIDDAAKNVERNENIHARAFMSTQTTPRRIGGR